MLSLYNSLTKQKEEFVPISPPQVSMYTCGMTVYDYAHIGHGRKYVGDDILRRTLTYLGYKVNHVQNVTDVGHLVSDADDGEDKLEKGARKSGKTVWEVADYYTQHFYDSMDQLNILRPHIVAKATDHIAEQIGLIEVLVKRGFAYETPEAVYFDVTKFATYNRLFGQNLDEKQVAVREEVETGSHKKHPADFALWFKRIERFETHAMHWDSPWGDGFPGWHIECSAMSLKYLGNAFNQDGRFHPENTNTIDIHTGGIDHLPIHHPNEIAQSEAATNVLFVKYWIHHAFLTVDGKKMSKSLGNFYTVEDVHEKGFDPIALRYLYLTTHYRKPLNFTWEALSNANNSLTKLKNQVAEINQDTDQIITSTPPPDPNKSFAKDFMASISDDINTPQALAVLWETLKSDLPSKEKLSLVNNFDQILGLDLLGQGKVASKNLPERILQLANERQQARTQNNFERADEIRTEINHAGYAIEDTPTGYQLTPREH